MPSFAPVPLDVPAEGVELRAIHAFERIDPRRLNEGSALESGFDWLASWPALLRHPDGTMAVCLRYGVVVFVGGSDAARDELFAALEAQDNPRRGGDVEYETLRLWVVPTGTDSCSGGEVRLSEVTAERLQLVSEVLGRSVLLASYEEVLRDFDGLVEPLARQLAARGASRQSSRALLRHMGTVLSIRLALFSRASVTESPDLLWEVPELERLFHHLMVEFDVRPRSAAIADRLQVLSDVAGAALELVRHSQTLRVEWYIVLLIVAEIALTLIGG